MQWSRAAAAAVCFAIYLFSVGRRCSLVELRNALCHAAAAAAGLSLSLSLSLSRSLSLSLSLSLSVSLCVSLLCLYHVAAACTFASHA
uniref:Putative secreted peptide n=1 Tax=Anopheles braziliensis TaxID=58242 RepID=A0A2M3ZMC3_9DIPT